ncbi:hypothetical protein AB4Y45_32980 [Paraburkholderia sp. EG287A]|uniref:hypothetical protein n=1 Tax=Paraburkholderia sp. EG287A TaxID=3237012 RepID=UPI0034D20635
MNIKIVTYKAMSERLNTVKHVLAELSARGVSAKVVHASSVTTVALQEALGVEALDAYTVAFIPVAADCIVLVDGDIIDRRTVSRLEELGKDVYFTAPQDALPPPVGFTLRDIVANAELFPHWGADDAYPRTFACHHVAETCMACEGSVVRWKAERRDAAVLASETNPN